jgi:hypothetical protein
VAVSSEVEDDVPGINDPRQRVEAKGGRRDVGHDITGRESGGSSRDVHQPEDAHRSGPE